MAHAVADGLIHPMVHRLAQVGTGQNAQDGVHNKKSKEKIKDKNKKTGRSYAAAGRPGSAELAHSSARGGGVPCVAALHFGGHAAQGLPKRVQAQVWGRH